MELAKTVDDLLKNSDTMDKYLHDENCKEHKFALYCLKYGRCFVVINKNGKYHFYPSKFIGYKNNNKENYHNAAIENDILCTDVEGISSKEQNLNYNVDAAYYTFDGRVSNKAINKILKCKCEKNEKISEMYIDYCLEFGIKGSNKKKFWLNVID